MAEDQWLMSVYQNGKAAYDRGDYQAATAEWDKLNGVLDRYPAFKTVIDYLQGRAKNIPSDDANEVDQKLTERNRRISTAFQKGKEAYDNGNFEKASAEWGKLAEYLPEDAPERRVLADFKKYYDDSLKTKPAAKAAPVMSAEEASAMRDFLESATSDLKKKAEQAKVSAGSVDAANQSAVKDAFEKSKWLYFQGNTADAIAELEKISSYFTPNSPERRAIEKMTLAYRQSQDIEKEAAQAVAKKDLKYTPPQDFIPFIEQIRDKFAAQIKEADVQRQAAEKIGADRQTWATEDLQKGRALFQEGKTDPAMEIWGKAAGSFENETVLRGRLQDLKLSYENSLKAAQAAKDAEAKKDAKLPAPEDFFKVLNDMQLQLQTQTGSADSRKGKAERALIDKQAFVSGGFQKGKAFFAEGKFEEALKEWSPILAGLEEEPKLKPLLDQSVKAAQDLAAARKAAEDAEARKDKKLSAPQELEKLLTDQTQKLTQLTDTANDQRRAAEKHLADRQNLVNNTFDQGKALFEEGKFSEAAKEWSAMTLELKDAEQVKDQMQAVEAAYQESMKAQESAKAAEAKKDEKFPSPPELLKLMAELDLRIKSQVESAQSRKSAAEKEFADKQAAVDGIFAKGKLAIDQGSLPDGLKEWSAMIPYLEEGAKVKESFESLNAGYENSLKIQQAAKDAESRKDSKLATPDELEKALSEISARTEAENQLAADRERKADGSLEDRKTLVRNTYLKGKAFFDEGKSNEALNEWSSILSNLEDEAKLKALFGQAAQDTQVLAASQKSAADAEARQDSKLKTPEGLTTLLGEVNTKLTMQIADAEDKKKKSEEYLAQRQRQLDEAAAKGNAYFEQGKWAEATAAWSEILPSMEDPKSFQDTLAELEKIHAERQKVQKALDESGAWKDVKFKAPADISKELAESRERLLAQTQEAEVAKQKAVQYLADRQGQVQQTFDRGKKFYWEGKIAEAIQEWTSIAPYLEDSSIKTSVQAVTANYEALLKIQQEAQGAELRKDSKLKTPDELPKILGDANQIITSQTQYAETQKKLADQTFVDRQSIINSTFQKGKTLYEQDRIPEALDEWATITPYLEKGSQLKAFIDNVAKNYQESQVAKKVAEEAETKKAIKFRSPEDLSKLLDEASQKLNAQAEDSKMQKEVAEKTRADRQAFIDANFEKGKTMYENGNISGAVDAWTALIPYIEDDAKIRQLILKVEENRRALQEASASTETPAPEPRAALPDDFEKMLNDSNRELEKKTGEKGRAKLEADVREVIQNKKASSKKAADKKSVKTKSEAIPMDEIEQMMVEYNVATPNEIEKRHQELKAAVK